jgi:hypothetical protein
LIGTAIQYVEGVRQVHGKGAVAPGIEGIAVAGDKADLAFDFGLLDGREWRQLQIRRCGRIEDQFGLRWPELGPETETVG